MSDKRLEAVRRQLLRLAKRREAGLVVLLVLTAAFARVRSPAFLELGNLRDILVQAAPVAIVSCGVMLVVLTGEIDISVGSLLGLTAAALGVVTSSERLGLPVALGVLTVLVLGGAVGLLNGILVTVGRVPSIIATLGMLTGLRGVTELLMGGEWITGLPADLRWFGTGSVLRIPVSIWAAAATIGWTAFLLHKLRTGRHIYAVGSNVSAAHLAAVPVRHVRIFAFAAAGMLTGLAALVSVPQLSVIESGIGTGFELLVVTCVVVGGVSVSGGRGGVSGVLLAVLLMVMMRTVLIFLRLGPMATYWERAIHGLFILAAVLSDHLMANQRRGPVS